jgi:uncharacterized repeat protein (TIGR01451 family)
VEFAAISFYIIRPFPAHRPAVLKSDCFLMNVRHLAAALVLVSGSAFASLVPVGPVPFSGTGIGAVNTVLTVGKTPVESGCVGWNGVADVIGAGGCAPGFTGGDERTGASQTQTRTIAQLGLTTATDLRIVLNMNESTGNSAILPDLALRIFDPSGAVLFTSGPFTAPTFPLNHSPGSTVGYVFELDPTQAAQAQLVFAPTNRVGLSADLTNTTAGNETFFVADVTAIGTPLFGADLAITKTAPATVIAGTTLTYTFNAVNNGPDPATTVVISDPLPTGTQFTSLTAPAGWTCTTPAVGTNGTITCSKASMALAETAAFTAVVRICPEVTCGTVLTNTATITSATIDPVTANGTASAATLVQTQADVGIAKTASAAAVNPGGSLIYTLTVTNAGPSNSAGTVVTDALPAGFTAISAVTSAGTCSGAGTASVTCTLGIIGAFNQCATSFPAGATITITATANPAIAPGNYTDTATVATGNCLADPNLPNNTSSVITVIPAGPVGADVAVAKVAPATVIAGTNLTYSTTVNNAGPTSATNVTMNDPLPAQTRFVSLAAPAGWACTTPATGAGGAINCTKASMAVAENAQFTTVVRVCADATCGTVISNSATVANTQPDPVAANNVSIATTTVEAQSDLGITKSTSGNFLLPGSSVTFTLSVTNAGPSNSAATSVVDSLPPDFTATSVSSTAGTCTGTTTVTCALGTLGAAGQCATSFPTSATITIAAQLASTAAPGTVQNTAIVSTGNCLADPNTANNTASVAISIAAPAAVASAGAPTLSEWGLLIFGALLLLMGLYFLRA